MGSSWPESGLKVLWDDQSQCHACLYCMLCESVINDLLLPYFPVLLNYFVQFCYKFINYLLVWAVGDEEHPRNLADNADKTLAAHSVIAIIMQYKHCSL